MRILIHGLNYSPEAAGIGRYTGEMGDWFARRGHEVRVVTAFPYYPAWRIKNGYSGWIYSSEIINRIKIYRCPLWVPKRLSGLKRIVHLLSFAGASLPILLWQSIFWGPNLVFVVAPALIAAPAGWLAARMVQSKTWLHIQDFEIDAAFELGILSNKTLKRMALALESWIMRRFDYVSAISKRMVNHLESKKVKAEKRVLFQNWVDTKTIYPLFEINPLRIKLGIGQDTAVLLYSGNMGEKQGLEIIIEVAKILKDEKDVLFLMCGDGSSRSLLEEMAVDLENVRFLPLQPESELNNLLNLADIHLLPQKARAADLVMPSKLTGMLASGRPIIAMAAQGTEVAEVLEGKGVLVPPGDVLALTAAIKELIQHPEDRLRFGRAGRQYAVKYLDKEVILSEIEKKFLELVKNKKK